MEVGKRLGVAALLVVISFVLPQNASGLIVARPVLPTVKAWGGEIGRLRGAYAGIVGCGMGQKRSNVRHQGCGKYWRSRAAPSGVSMVFDLFDPGARSKVLNSSTGTILYSSILVNS